MGQRGVGVAKTYQGIEDQGMGGRGHGTTIKVLGPLG